MSATVTLETSDGKKWTAQIDDYVPPVNGYPPLLLWKWSYEDGPRDRYFVRRDPSRSEYVPHYVEVVPYAVSPDPIPDLPKES